MHSDGGGLPDSAACLAERAMLGSWLVQHQYRDPQSLNKYEGMRGQPVRPNTGRCPSPETR